MRQRISATTALVLALAVCPRMAVAQETRAEVLEKQRAEKASSLRPYRPGKLEKWMLWYEENDVLGRLAPHNGFYAQYGFQWKPVGSGIGVGGGFRHDLFDRRARVDVGGGITYRNYHMLQADFSLPYLADERLEAGVRVVYNHNPQEDFWGFGLTSLSENRVSFGADFTDYQARAIARPVRWLQAAVRYGRLNADIGRGADSRFPSIERRFSDADAPGLLAQPDYSYGELMGVVDYRDQAGNARDGGYYAARWRKYNDLDLDRYSFREIDLHGQQFFPIFDKKRVFAVQARLIATDPENGHEVPFYFRPTVGGSNSLRSYNDYRFRDNNVLYLNAEYRWEAFSGLDMALFYDLGTVARELEDLSLSNAENGYGIGLRFNTYKSVWMRLDVGFGGNEGIQYFFKFSKAF
jgi:outer membrane protein assembly factor BamA